MVESAGQLQKHLNYNFLERDACDILFLSPGVLLSLNVFEWQFFLCLLIRQTNNNKQAFFLSIYFLSIILQVGDICRQAECVITKLSFMFYSVILYHADINTKDKCKTFQLSVSSKCLLIAWELISLQHKLEKDPVK